MMNSVATPDLRVVFAPLDITAKISDISSDVRRFGGLADIYEGVLDADGGQVKVAIKFIRANAHELEKVMRRHRREVKIWYGIKHPYILPLLGLYWGSRSLPALVSTWCEHGNIRSYLRTLPSGPEGIARKHEILHQIAQGLAHLHGQTPPIVHGDLKGDNILVSDDGLPKICDFGLSKIIAVTTETVTHFRGTLRWMAPELLCDDPVSTSASDIWAYGCIMIEVFSGSRPYTEKASDNAVVLALSRREMPSRPADMSDACWKLARKCFEHNPNKRITALDIIGDPVFTSVAASAFPPSSRQAGGVWSPIQAIVSAASAAVRPRKPLYYSDMRTDDLTWSLGSPSVTEAESIVESSFVAAKALYAYFGSPQDPNELSFSKGEILKITDREGRWWQGEKSDGSMGIVPSNYFQIIDGAQFFENHTRTTVRSLR